VGNVNYWLDRWLDHKTYGIDQVALLLHHELWVIHAFPNGNGRHARMMANVLVTTPGGDTFSGGGKNIVVARSPRAAYLNALCSADNGDIGPLMPFSRS
jgi:fido (protein-threonine AMPylation protein)